MKFEADSEQIGEIEQWALSLEAMRFEWEKLIKARDGKRRQKRARLAEQWNQQFDEVRSEYFDLVNRGLWHRGPSDVFSILGRERRETYHSAMLAWLFDPLGPHGLGVSFFRAFLQACHSEWSLEHERPGAIEVRCEEAGAFCRADIVVRTSRFTLIIENKLDAVEGDAQCNRLHQAFCDGGDVRFVFLSPSGRRPRTATGEAAQAFVPLSYSVILKCLESVLKDTAGSPPTMGRASALNYMSTLNKEFA